MTHLDQLTEIQGDVFQPKLVAVGDRGIGIVLGDSIDPAIHQKINALCQRLEQSRPAGVLEWVPTYGALLIVYDPLATTVEALIEALLALLVARKVTTVTDEPVIEIPVCYGGDFGPDLEAVAAHTHLSVEEVVLRHTAPEYLIHMLGFTPGFPYLGGMDERLETPRLKTPRTKIPAGAVGIAGKQTGVYPSASPGGWQLIGQTPLKLFDASRAEPFLLRAGQKLKFVSITAEQFEALAMPTVDAVESVGTIQMGAPIFEVLQSGPLTTIQDLGRHGYRQYGVSSGGVMDTAACLRANALVGNEPDAAVLEMTFSGVALKVLKPCLVACCGATVPLCINGRAAAQNRSYWLHAGDELTMGAFESGLRSYLAVRGGFAGDRVMGSLSTDLKGGFGGLSGRKLSTGDLLFRDDQCQGTLEAGREQRVKTPTNDVAGIPAIRILRGPQAHLFTQEDLDALTAQPYQVTPECDRMGMRLSGATLSPIGGGDILSDGILPGAVQVPGHGQPIVMLADCQTTGGYAKIAQVITADLSKLAQLRPGESFSFEWVTLDKAQMLYNESQRLPKTIEIGLQWQLTVNGQAFEVEVEEME